MKHCISIFLLLFLFNRLEAQETTQLNKKETDFNNFSIGISAGVSLPIGNFAKNDYKDNSSGFAGTGYNVGFTGTKFLNKNWGISFLFSYTKFGSYDGMQSLAYGFQKDFEVDSASATVKNSSHLINFLIGPTYSLPIRKKIFLETRALVGFTSAELAGWDVVLTDSKITHPAFSQNSSTATCFGLLAGLGLRYNLSTNWAILLNGDYQYCKPNFSITNSNRNANTGRELNKYNENISSIAMNLTFVRFFGK